MCTGDTCFGPDLARWAVTRPATGEKKNVWALTPEGAMKIANWPPAICEAKLIIQETIWVEADQADGQSE